MKKNPLINIKVKSSENIFKPENFLNTKNKSLLLPSESIDVKIYKKIKECSEKFNNLNLKDKEIISTILKSYENVHRRKYLGRKEFILTLQEINEFFNISEENILRYVAYRYKYNQFPKLKILDIRFILERILIK